MSIDYLAFSSIRYLATYSLILIISLMQVVYFNTCDLSMDRRCHGRPVNAVSTMIDYDRDKSGLFSTIMASPSIKWDREPLGQGMSTNRINRGAKGGTAYS